MGSFLTQLKEFFGWRARQAGNKDLSMFKSLDALFHQMVVEGKAPGISVTILKKGAILLQKGYGYAKLETRQRIDPENTLLRAASVSKPIAATALLKMVQDGLLDLNASLYDYLPDFPKKAYDFNLRQLAAHSAGIRGYRGKEYALNKEYSIQEGLRIFMDDPLLFEPGTAFHYTSYDWVLLSAVMEKVAGIPFADYVTKYVLNPLKMHHTVPENEPEKTGELAVFYSGVRRGFQKASPVNNSYKLAGGGYLSTSADIARLGRAYLQGEVGDPKLLDCFLNTQYIDGKPTYYGLGWEVSRDHRGRPFFGHTGNSVGAYSKLQVYPDAELVIAILVNCTKPGLEEGLAQMSDLLHGHPLPNSSSKA